MITLWTIYERPNPLQYVARLSRIGEPDHGERLMVSTYLDTLRATLVRRGLQRIAPRSRRRPGNCRLWV